MGRKYSDTELEVTKVQTVVSVYNRKWVKAQLKDVKDSKNIAIADYDSQIAELQALLDEMIALGIKE